MTETEENKQVAFEILRQLGGNQFAVMTGSERFTVCEKGLSMKLKRNSSGGNHMKISLEFDDTYTVRIYSARMPNFKMVKEIHGVYNDMLQSIFTQETGLYTRL